MEVTPIPDWQIWLWDTGIILIHIYFWALKVAGLAICFVAFRRTLQRGYLLIALYFLIPFGALIFKELSERRLEAELREHGTQVAESNYPVRNEQVATFPLIESFLVLGLYFVTKKQKDSNQSPEPTSTVAPRRRSRLS